MLDKMSKEIVRRPATMADQSFACEAHHLGYRPTVISQFGSWDDSVQDKFFEETWNTYPHEILLRDGKTCGFLSVEQKPDYIHIRELVIHPEFGDLGIGAAVLQEIINQANKLNLPVKLGVLLKNDAFNFYKKYGFVEYDRTDLHILMQRPPAPSHQD